VDEEAAVAVYGKAEKAKLKESPWSREFQFETERRLHPDTAESDELVVAPAIIERYVKNFKSHRSIYDSTCSFRRDKLIPQEIIRASTI
jgi:hypothetical protein